MPHTSNTAKGGRGDMSQQLSDRLSQQHRICNGSHGRAVAGVTTQQLKRQLCAQAFFKAPQLSTQAFLRFSYPPPVFCTLPPLKVHPLLAQVQGSFLNSREGSFSSFQKVQDASALSQTRGQKRQGYIEFLSTPLPPSLITGLASSS